MILAGLDQALRRSGASVLQDDKFIRAEAFVARGETHGEIFHQFREWWSGFLTKHKVEHAAIEEPLRSDLSRMEFDNNPDAFGVVQKRRVPMTNMQTLLGLYGVRAHAIEVCEGLGIPCRETNVQDWRQVILGRRQAPKGTRNSSLWWKEQALARCKLLGWSVPSKDAAESALIAEWLRIQLNPRMAGHRDDLFAKTG